MIKDLLKKKNSFLEYFIKNIFFHKFTMFSIGMIIMLSECYLSFCPILEAVITFIIPKICCFILLIYLLQFKFSKFSIALLGYTIVAILASVLGEKTTIENTLIYLPIFSLSLYLEMGIRNNCKQSIKSLALVMFILVFINFLTIILFPDGLYFNGLYSTNWFLKYDNSHIFIFLPTIILLYISSSFNDFIFYNLYSFSIITITFCVYYCFSANTMMAYTLLLIYLIFNKKLSNLKILNEKFYIFSTLSIFIFIVIFRMQHIFSWLLVDILHKGLTLNNRTKIWDMVIEKIKKAPLLGYGLESSGQFAKKFNVPHYTHAHNTILDILYKGGILLLACFFAIIKLTFNKLKQNKHNISKLISFTLFCMFLMMTFEAREDKIGLYIILTLGYNINYIIDNINKSKENFTILKNEI